MRDWNPSIWWRGLSCIGNTKADPALGFACRRRKPGFVFTQKHSIFPFPSDSFGRLFRYCSNFYYRFNQSISKLDSIIWMLRKRQKFLNLKFFTIWDSRILKIVFYLKLIWLPGWVDLSFLIAKKVREVTY